MEKIRLLKRLTESAVEAFRKTKPWFTLAELIVVVTILAVLATIGFIAFSGYAKDAAESRAKANVRSVYAAINSESASTGNSPRYYVIHDPNYGLSWAVVVFENVNAPLVWGDWNAAWTNYSAGNPDFVKLKLNSEKFRVSSSWLGGYSAEAAANSSMPIVWAADVAWNGAKSRIVSYVQVAGIPESWVAFVVGNYPVNSSGSVAGLIKDPSGTSMTGAIVEGAATISCDSGNSWNGSSCVANAWSSGSWGACTGETGSWSYGAWGSCSVSCGGGTQTRTATCTRNSNGTQSRTAQCLRYDGAVLTDSDCLTAKPSASQSCTQWSDSVCGTVGATSQSCNTQSCNTCYQYFCNGAGTYGLKYSWWSCVSAMCISWYCTPWQVTSCGSIPSCSNQGAISCTW